MALEILRSPSDTLLELNNPETGLFPINHILEPEYHQDKYVSVVQNLSKSDAWQIGNSKLLVEYPHRGTQPTYTDDENDPLSLEWLGMMRSDGITVSLDSQPDICALKSVSVRFGYVDYESARSVSPEFYTGKKKKAGVQQNDVLINSTGDGTIGRIAVFNGDFPALADGHITIVRFSDPTTAWYVAAFLLSDAGQKQIYRYINGSSGQVEIYPQDIARLWIRDASDEVMTQIADDFRSACIKHYQFQRELKKALSQVN